MEEKKKPGQEKLSYEQLAKNFGELHLQYQKLYAEYQKAMEALNNRDFDYSSFFLSALFRVMEHPEMYNDKFVEWASKHVEDALYAYDKAMTQGQSEMRTDEAE